MFESGFTGFRDFQDIPNLEYPLTLIHTSATGKDFAQAHENLVSLLDLEVISRTRWFFWHPLVDG